MTDMSGPKPPPPCSACGSTDHSTGYHDSTMVPGDYDVDYPTTLETEMVLENRTDDRP